MRYLALAEALCLALVQGHPFVDGNKRVGHAAMETFLVLNSAEIDAPIGDQEQPSAGAAGSPARARTTPSAELVSSWRR